MPTRILIHMSVHATENRELLVCVVKKLRWHRLSLTRCMVSLCMCIAMCMGMSTVVCTGMCAAMYIGMCIAMHTDIRIGMYTDIRIGMYTETNVCMQCTCV